MCRTSTINPPPRSIRGGGSGVGDPERRWFQKIKVAMDAPRRTVDKVSGNSVRVTPPRRGGVFRAHHHYCQGSTRRSSVGRRARVTLNELWGSKSNSQYRRSLSPCWLRCGQSVVKQMYVPQDGRALGVPRSRDPNRGPFRREIGDCLAFPSFISILVHELQPAALSPSIRVRAPLARPAWSSGRGNWSMLVDGGVCPRGCRC